MTAPDRTRDARRLLQQAQRKPKAKAPPKKPPASQQSFRCEKELEPPTLDDFRFFKIDDAY